MKTIYHYHIYNSNRGDQAIHQSIHDMIERVHGEKINWIPKCLNNDVCTKEVIKEMNEQGDMLIIGGSGLYVNAWKNYEGAYWYFPCDQKLFKEIKIPIVLWSLGMNKDFSGEEEPLTEQTWDSIAEMNELCAMSSVRDERTFDNLLWHGIKTKLIADPALFLQPDTKIENAELQRLIIDNDTLGLNLASHTECARAIRDKSIDKIIDMCHAWTGSIVYLKHHEMEHRSIKLLKKKGLNPYVVDCEPKQLLYVMQHLSRAINMMLHNCILCVNAELPVYNIPYNVKHEGFFNLFSDSMKCTGSDAYMIKCYDDQILRRKRKLKQDNDDWCRRVAELLN